MKKKIVWTAALVLLASIAIAVFWELRPQAITSDDGAKLTLVGVTYGRHHIFKGIRTSGWLRHGRSTLDTTNDTLVVWIETQQKGGGNPLNDQYQLLVYDPANTACVGAWPSLSISRHIKAGVDIHGFILNAFPRRDSKMILRISSWGDDMRPKGQFVISNPGPRMFPEWQPDPMPDKQSDGDLDVTLTKCIAGTPGFYPAIEDFPSKDPIHKGVLVVFHTEQNGRIVTNWDPVAIETYDATGNKSHLRSWSVTHDTNNDFQITYQWGLWPDEPAWKLRVEMSRTSGFTNVETHKSRFLEFTVKPTKE